MKGIILAGGSGTRLFPITKGVSKQLLPIYDKPMIYYPLSVHMLAGIKDILIITTPEDQEAFKRLLGDGSDYGIKLSYVVQPSPDGLAQAFKLGEKFIGDDSSSLILGDNIFYGNDFIKQLREARNNAENNLTSVFCIEVPDPERFGVAEIDESNKVIRIEEKPEHYISNLAITGLYFYGKGVSEKAHKLKPSKRGELEITDLNRLYLEEEKLVANILGGGFDWYDTGTTNSLLDASSAIRTIQNNKGKIIACLEQIGYDLGWLSKAELLARAEVLRKNAYGEYLFKTAEREPKGYEKTLKLK